MAVLVLLQHVANGAEKEEDWLISCFRIVLMELMAAWSCGHMGRVMARSHVLPVPEHTGFNRHGVISASAGRTIWTELVETELSLASCEGWDYSNISHVYQIPIFTAFKQAKTAQFAARAGFLNVMGAINCSHVAIKAPSRDEFIATERIFSCDANTTN